MTDPACEACGQPMRPAPRALRASHRVETEGRPPLFCLRASDAEAAATERLPEVSHVYSLVPEESYWRSFP